MSATQLDNTQSNDTFVLIKMEFFMRCLAFAFTFLAAPLQAHELWIEPLAYQVNADSIAAADVVNGENFEGTKLAYVPQRFRRFVAVNGGQFANVQGRIGDRPALQFEPIGEGLHVIAYQSNVSIIDYKEWEKFQTFVDHKDLGDVAAAHQERGLPDANFDEAYSRYSKTLIGVGNSEGDDRRLGFVTEIVALDNPYTTDGLTDIRLQLFYNAEVRSDEQIEVFEKAADGTVTISLHRTNEEGIATVPVKAGHSYMADAVVLREPSEKLASETGAVWETLWANLTWAMPE